jgi:hypothetical protein
MPNGTLSPAIWQLRSWARSGPAQPRPPVLRPAFRQLPRRHPADCLPFARFHAAIWQVPGCHVAAPGEVRCTTSTLPAARPGDSISASSFARPQRGAQIRHAVESNAPSWRAGWHGNTGKPMSALIHDVGGAVLAYKTSLQKFPSHTKLLTLRINPSLGFQSGGTRIIPEVVSSEDPGPGQAR